MRFLMKYILPLLLVGVLLFLCVPATAIASGGFQVTPDSPGDANGDGYLNAIDITKIERIIASLDATTPGADVNLDSSVDSLDITKIERLILGLEPPAVITSSTPGIPQNVTVTSITDNSVSFSWDAPAPDETAGTPFLVYSIYVREISMEKYSFFASTTKYFIDIFGLLPDTTYLFKVNAMTDTGIASQFCDPIEITTYDILEISEVICTGDVPFDVYSERDRIHILLNLPTNAPYEMSKEAIDDLFIFSDPIGEDYFGESYVDGRQISIVITSPCLNPPVIGSTTVSLRPGSTLNNPTGTATLSEDAVTLSGSW